MISVFKTSVKTQTQVKQLKPYIDQLLPNAKWNFDLEDSEKILRIESDETIATQITDLLTIHEFQCEELE